MKKEIRGLFIFGAIVLPLYAILVICVSTGTIIASYSGFALDNNGFLYVGENHEINVYGNGEFIKTVYKPARGYSFTIQDETLYVADAGIVRKMDLEGNLIEKSDDIGTIEMNRLYRQRNMFVTNDAKYMANGIFGYYKITKYKNGGGTEIVYQSPLFTLVFQIAGTIGFVSFVLLVLAVRFRLLPFKKAKT